MKDIKLLFRASEHGWGWEDFYNYCGDQGPVFTFVFIFLENKSPNKQNLS